MTPKEHKLTVLNYAKKHGICAAAKYYKVNRNTITLWNHELHVLPERTRRKFTLAQKQEILRFANKNGISNAARRYRVTKQIITKWANQLGIYQHKGPEIYTRKYKIEAVKRSYEIGTEETVKGLGVLPKRLDRWIELFEKSGDVRPNTTIEQRRIILRHARRYGYDAASRKYGFSVMTLRIWNVTLKIVPLKLTRYTPEQKIIYLNMALDILKELPLRKRSIKMAFTTIYTQHNVAVDYLYRWNKQYNIINKNSTYCSPDEVTEINRVLTENKGKITTTAHIIGITKYLLLAIIQEYHLNRGQK